MLEASLTFDTEDRLAGIETAAGSPTDPFGYNAQSGYVLDRETGLYACMFRYYDPARGRWLNRDPIGYSGGMNLYGYCASGPVGWSDASGLKGYWEQVGDVFAGYGDALNPVNWWNGMTGLYHTAVTDGFGDAASQLGSGMLRMVKFWEADDARDFGNRFGGTLLLMAPGLKRVPGLSGGGRGRGAASGSARLLRPGRRGSPDHVATVADCEAAIVTENPSWTHVAGGSIPEKTVNGTGRAPDLWFTDPGNGNHFYQVGRLSTSGLPVGREWAAGTALAGAGQVHFIPVIRP